MPINLAKQKVAKVLHPNPRKNPLMKKRKRRRKKKRKIVMMIKHFFIHSHSFILKKI